MAKISRLVAGMPFPCGFALGQRATTLPQAGDTSEPPANPGADPEGS
jgi:hypothetical protein